MTWVRRTEAPAKAHVCGPPMRELVFEVPPPPPPPRAGKDWKPGPPSTWTVDKPDGERGDLWRCDDCGKLWRNSGFGQWERATWWERWRNR